MKNLLLTFMNRGATARPPIAAIPRHLEGCADFAAVNSDDQRRALVRLSLTFAR